MNTAQMTLHASLARRIARLERRFDCGEDRDGDYEKLEALYDLRRESHLVRGNSLTLGKDRFGT